MISRMRALSCRSIISACPIGALTRHRSALFWRKTNLMDATRFDQVIRALTVGASRRGLLRGLSGAALGAAASRLPGAAQARKKKRKKPTLNAFGCADVGQPCRGNDDVCCSGICGGKKPKKGKRDKRTCVAHNTGACEAGQDRCSQATPVVCGPGAACVRTTGNASFCGVIATGACTVCTSDRDCQTLFGSEAACIVCATCPETGGAACLPAGA